MLTDKKIEEYRKNKKPTCVFNYLIEKTDRDLLRDIANKKGLSMSEAIRLLIKEFIKEQDKMLTDKKIEEYRRNKKPARVMSFRIEKTDRDGLVDIATKKGVYMSEIVRPLIKEFIKEQKKIGETID